MALGYVVNTKGRVSAKPSIYPANTGSQTIGRNPAAPNPTALDIWLGKADAKAAFPFATNRAQYQASAHARDVFYKPTTGTKDWSDTNYRAGGGYAICSLNSRLITKDGKVVCEANVRKAYTLTEAEKTLDIDTTPSSTDSTAAEMASVRGLGATAAPVAPEDAFLAAQTKRFRIQEVALVGVLALAGLYIWKSRK